MNGDGTYDYLLKQPNANIGPATPGMECYSSDTDSEKKSKVRWLFDAKGNLLRDDLDWGFGLRNVYWDGDLQRELIRGANIVKYTGGEYRDVIQGPGIG